MDLLSNLAIGVETAFTLNNLAWCFAGVLLGTLIGVLPGIGPLATIAILLPITYKMGDPSTALIMLAGIYYGSQYGGSTTAILVNLPGESASVVTTLDGYQMARKGKAGLALATAALGSFFAGTVATFLIAAFAPPLAELAFKFGPAEYFSLMVMGLIAAVVLAHGSFVKALAMVVLGLLLGLMGTDVNSGVARFTFGVPELIDGIEFAVIAMGLFGFSEIIYNLKAQEARDLLKEKVTDLVPSRQDVRRAAPAVVRGTMLGSFLGILPGGGGILSSFASYAIEKKISKHPEEFGKGAIEGVAGPESANNAGAQTSFIPVLTLGIPTTPVMALMVAAMMIHDVQPGPQVMTANPSLFWGLIVSMWVGNFFLVILNLPLIGIWIKLLQVPYRLLYPAILIFCCIGAYSINNSVWEVLMIIPFAILGYYFKKWKCEPAPLLLGFILGEMMEEYLRRALTLSRGDWWVLLDRPLSATLLGIAAVLIILMLLPSIRKKREEAFEGEQD
ncbi:MAG: tripartite tricarboxylate transporter permease [Betaproteobacteria bacterium]|nr:tripartite tricarboxylate transporter permease [Betaproteobacteria bacterium]